MYFEYILLFKTNFIGSIVKSFIISTTVLLIVTFTVLFINNVVNNIAKTKRYNH